MFSLSYAKSIRIAIESIPLPKIIVLDAIMRIRPIIVILLPHEKFAPAPFYTHFAPVKGAARVTVRLARSICGRQPAVASRCIPLLRLLVPQRQATACLPARPFDDVEATHEGARADPAVIDGTVDGK